MTINDKAELILQTYFNRDNICSIEDISINDIMKYMVDFATIQCELQKQECANQFKEESFFTKDLILHANNVCIT